MQNCFIYFISQNFKIVNYEIIFVRSKGAKAEHTWAYVNISLSADSCKKNSSERFLFVSFHCFIHLSLRVVGFKILALIVRLATSCKSDSNLCQTSLIEKESQADNG